MRQLSLPIRLPVSLVYRRAEFKIVEQRSQIVWQLPMGSIITPRVLKWLAGTIRDYYCQLSPLAPDWTTESDRCEEREPSAPTKFYFVKQVNENGTFANKLVWICAHTMAYKDGFFRNTMEMISISIVVGILSIHGTTGGRTVWALTRDLRIAYVFNARGGLNDVSYPHVGMDSIWLSDSPNWV